MLFPAADTAADAVNKFKNSTMDNKELFVRVLPTIHVSSCKFKSKGFSLEYFWKYLKKKAKIKKKRIDLNQKRSYAYPVVFVSSFL